jgi:transcriptional regulator NrdR family protein
MKAVPLAAGQHGPEQRQERPEEDLCWFRRTRECSMCGRIITTAEIDEACIGELINLRRLAKATSIHLAQTRKGLRLLAQLQPTRPPTKS